MMNLPNIRYYALLTDTTAEGKQTQKFAVAKAVGYYPPMEQLKTKKGSISFYLMEKLKEGLDAPAYRLQGKSSLNFTGLKDYFVDGKLTGFAYGYPMDTKTYGKESKPNPFYDYRADGYLFKIKTNADATKPVEIELLVLENAKPLIASYCKMLQQGGFDEALELMRKQAVGL